MLLHMYFHEFDPTIWESAPVKIWDDGTITIGHSVIANASRTQQVHGARCGIIAIYEAIPELYIQGILSPWMLFNHLIEMGWKPTCDQTQIEDLTVIANILGCRFKVQYNNIYEVCGRSGPSYTLKMRGAHYLNGDQK